ncbi:MAG: glycosyltransferase family 2 protein [Oscillospiraceae bacterium]|nr:glycosyltransferase family 2 protein [Oscillospiraceae bacterium]
MTNGVRISVVIPMYNGADRIVKCIDSLDDQDCGFQYEVLIVDDCSTDESASLVESYIRDLKHGESFRLIRSPQNGRAGAARNIGIRESKGHYILFNDQDDYVDRKCLRVLWENSQDGDIDVVSCSVMDRNGIPYRRPHIGSGLRLTEDERKAIMSRYGYVFASLIKRSLLTDNDLRFPENLLFEDCLFNVGVIACADTIRVIDDVLYYREDDQNSQTASFTPKKLSDRIDAVKFYLDNFRDKAALMPYDTEVRSIAFYYIYLSCMLYLMAIPNLYSDALFDRCLTEGKALNISWKEVLDRETGLSKPILLLLRQIYYRPAIARPLRLCGTTMYRLKKAVKKARKR